MAWSLHLQMHISIQTLNQPQKTQIRIFLKKDYLYYKQLYEQNKYQ